MKRTFALSHFRTFALVPLLAGCEQEDRNYREVPPATTPFPAVMTTDIQAGPPTVDPAVGAYQENRWAVGQGMRLYTHFNCAGCHAPGGGGGMGPPLNDEVWIYGSDPENIYATVVEGRPNGMPSFRGRISSGQLWQLVAYVRYLGGYTPKDTWPGRTDHMAEARPEHEPPDQRELP